MKLSVVARVTGAEVVVISKVINPYYDRPDFKKVEDDFDEAVSNISKTFNGTIVSMPKDVEDAIDEIRGPSSGELPVSAVVGQPVPVAVGVEKAEDVPSLTVPIRYRIHILQPFPKVQEAKQ